MRSLCAVELTVIGGAAALTDGMLAWAYYGRNFSTGRQRLTLTPNSLGNLRKIKRPGYESPE
jgi:hypothetical protein